MAADTKNQGSSALASGVSVFAGIMMMVNGVMMVLYGISAIAKDNVWLTTPNYVFKFNLETWGWIHLLLGALVIVVGYAVLAGKAWGRSAGIAITALAALSNFLAIPYYPLWALILLAIDVLIIWGLATASD